MMFMKQKQFTFLALLTVAVSGAWATTTVVYERTLTSWTSNDVNNGAGTWIANDATVGTATVMVYGNIMSLVDVEGFATVTAIPSN
jgi:hypothetical protein